MTQPIDSVIALLSDANLHPPRHLVGSAVSDALASPDGYDAPFHRFAHEGERAKDAFFRVSCSSWEGRRHLNVQYGTNKGSLIGLYGGTSRGITKKILVGEGFKPPSKPRSISSSVNKSKALAHQNSGLVPVASMQDHPYLVHKGIDVKALRGALPQIFIASDNNILSIPVGRRDDVVAYTLISPPNQEGVYQKKNVGSISGGYTPIGFTDSPTSVALCEGFASAVAHYRTTGCPTIATHGTGNVVSALKSILSDFPTITDTYLSLDDDKAGRACAQSALEAFKASGRGRCHIVTWSEGMDPHDAMIAGISPTITLAYDHTIISSLVNDAPDKAPDIECLDAAIPTIDESRLPSMFREFLQLRCSGVSADQRGAAILSILAAYSSVVGSRYYVATSDDDRTYACMWLMIMGCSGKGKSYVMSIGLKLASECANVIAQKVSRVRDDQKEDDALCKKIVESCKSSEMKDPEVQREYSAYLQRKYMRDKRITFLERNRFIADNVNLAALDLYQSSAGSITIFSNEAFKMLKGLERQVGGDPTMELVDRHSRSAGSKILVSGAGDTSTYSSLGLITASTLSKMGELAKRSDVASGFFPRIAFALIAGQAEDKFKRRDRSFRHEPVRKVFETSLGLRAREICLAGVGIPDDGSSSLQLDDLSVALGAEHISYDTGRSVSIPQYVDKIMYDFLDDEVAPIIKTMCHEEGDFQVFANRIHQRITQYAILFESMIDKTVNTPLSVSVEAALAAIEVSRYEVHCGKHCLSSLIGMAQTRAWRTPKEHEDAILRFIRAKAGADGWIHRRVITAGCSSTRTGRGGSITNLEMLVRAGILLEKRDESGKLCHKIADK